MGVKQKRKRRKREIVVSGAVEKMINYNTR